MPEPINIKLPTCPDCGSPLESFSIDGRQRVEFTCASMYEREEHNEPWMCAAQSPVCVDRAVARARIAAAPSWSAS